MAYRQKKRQTVSSHSRRLFLRHPIYSTGIRLLQYLATTQKLSAKMAFQQQQKSTFKGQNLVAYYDITQPFKPLK